MPKLSNVAIDYLEKIHTACDKQDLNALIAGCRGISRCIGVPATLYSPIAIISDNALKAIKGKGKIDWDATFKQVNDLLDKHTQIVGVRKTRYSKY